LTFASLDSLSCLNIGISKFRKFRTQLLYLRGKNLQAFIEWEAGLVTELVCTVCRR